LRLLFQAGSGIRFLASRTRSSAAHELSGRDTTPSGEQVRVFTSDAFTPNPAVNQSWANLLASTIHGSELGRVTLYLVTWGQVAFECGPGAFGCYDPASQLIIISGQSPALVGGGFTLEDVAIHEYGHHVANNRRNDPWLAYETGTKRWASYEGICPNIRAGSLDPNLYTERPAEGFAEAYLVTNGGRWGGIVSQFFFPNALAQSLIAEDVRHPWTGTRQRLFTAMLGGPAARSRSSLSPAGPLWVGLRGPRGTDFDLFLEAGTRVLRGSARRGSRESVSYTVCGDVVLAAVIRSHRGTGLARVIISKP
jgi:hypothetical protein